MPRELGSQTWVPSQSLRKQACERMCCGEINHTGVIGRVKNESFVILTPGAQGSVVAELEVLFHSQNLGYVL